MSAHRAIGAFVATCLLALLPACGALGGASSPPAPQVDLASALAQADREVLASRFGVADKLLVDFAEKHAATAEGLEAAFWRAVYKLDPANQTASAHEAVVLLDAYLGASLAGPHRGAATTLRHAAAALERGPTVVTTTVQSAPSGGGAKSDESRARDDEIARLKEELSKANAELERIKRRVATPKP